MAAMSDDENILSFRRLEQRQSDSRSTDSRSTSESTTQRDSASNVESPDRSGPKRDTLPITQQQGAQPFAWQDLRDEQPLVPVQIRLGAARCPANEASPTATGSIVVLDRTVDEPVEIVVAGEVVGLGRLVVAQNKLAIEVCEVMKTRRQKTA